jgi:endonuclease G
MRKHFLFIALLVAAFSCVAPKSYIHYRATNDASGGRLLEHSCFTVWYSDACKQPIWVAYTLYKGDLDSSAIRKDNFRPDPTVPESVSAKLSDYAQSGYDRGHIAPAGDMKRSQQCMDESFYLSNISPQIPAHNRGVWKRLEDKVRTYAVLYDSVVVVTGPILTGEMQKIGSSEVCVPPSYYKALLVHHNGSFQSIAFVVPNEGSSADLATFVLTVDQLEQLTGIDYFPYLPKSVQDKIESVADYTLW